MQASGLGTIGAAFLYLDALKRQAIFDAANLIQVFTLCLNHVI